MQVRLKIRRYDPDRDARAYWQEFDVEADPMDRILDALNSVKWYQDGSLTYRRSCAHGVCGSDAMVVNGRNRLACKELIRDVGKRLQIEPLRGFNVIKDLVVDMEPFFAKYRAIKPYLINDDPPPEHGERPQSPEERAVYDDTTKCILCGACTGACPPFWTNNQFVGPASIVNAHRFIFDSRDEGTEERLPLLNSREGVWRCRTVFNCVDACPRDIDITKAIGDIKKLILMQ
jgi:succinate dehydrogenase / fumarate reductase, iron-sulfur subunit